MTTLEVWLLSALFILWLLGGYTIYCAVVAMKLGPRGPVSFVTCCLVWPFIGLYSVIVDKPGTRRRL